MKFIFKLINVLLFLCPLLYLNLAFARGDVIAVNQSSSYVIAVAVTCDTNINHDLQLWLYNNGVTNKDTIYKINCKDFYLTAFVPDKYGHVSEMLCDTIKVQESNNDKTRYYTVYGKNSCKWS